MLLSRADLADRYKLAEATLVHLEELDGSPLSDAANRKVSRGRIVYEVTDQVDVWLRVGRASFPQFRGRLMPCQRAIMLALITEADPGKALKALKDRGILPAAFRPGLIGAYWQELLWLAPPECQAFLTGQQQDPDPVSALLLQQAGIREAFDDPELLADKFYWLNTPELRVLTDAFLTVQADVSVLRKYLADAHRFDVADDDIRVYRRYFFDMTVCGTKGAAAFADMSSNGQYRSVVGNAARDGTLGDVVSELKLSSLIDHRISMEAALAKSRVFIAANPSRPAGVSAQVYAIKAMQDVYYTVNMLEHNMDTDTHDDAAIMEILKLKHNQEVNAQQLSLTDLPKEARDAFNTGPIKARS